MSRPSRIPLPVANLQYCWRGCWAPFLWFFFWIVPLVILLPFVVISAESKALDITTTTTTTITIISAQLSRRAAFRIGRPNYYLRSSVPSSSSTVGVRTSSTTSKGYHRPFTADIPTSSFHRSFAPTISSTRLFFLSSSTTNIYKSPAEEITQKGHDGRRFYSQTGLTKMPRGVKKEHLPSKVCLTCGRPFTWRKKWEKVWDEVTTCSKSCNHKRRLAKQQQQQQPVGQREEAATENSSVIRRVDHQEQPKSTYNTSRIDSGMSNSSLQSDNSSSLLHGSTEFSTLDPQEQQHQQHQEGEASIWDDEKLLVIAVLGQDQGLVEQETPDEAALRKAERKAAKKAKKAERRAQREGRGDPTAGQKECDMCSQSVDLLIRCMYEEGQTDWKMVCGKCWKVASGGVVDGDANHPHYRYGGLWKNRRAQK